MARGQKFDVDILFGIDGGEHTGHLLSVDVRDELSLIRLASLLREANRSRPGKIEYSLRVEREWTEREEWPVDEDGKVLVKEEEPDAARLGT